MRLDIINLVFDTVFLLIFFPSFIKSIGFFLIILKALKRFVIRNIKAK